MSADEWQKVVEPHFAFLDEHGFALKADASESNFWVTRVVYASRDRAVEIDRSVEFSRVEVYLLRLQDGRMPKAQVWVTDAPINRMLLDNVLEARIPAQCSEINRLDGLQGARLEEQLAARAKALRDVASDFFEKSFSAMTDGERVVRQRLDTSRQEIVVWLPHDATPEEEQSALEDARATAPPEVSVIARRYERPAG